MNCECGKEISIWDIILPWRKNYKLLVVDDDGSITEKVRICEDCYHKYEELMKLVGEIGIDNVMEMLENLEEVNE